MDDWYKENNLRQEQHFGTVLFIRVNDLVVSTMLCKAWTKTVSVAFSAFP